MKNISNRVKLNIDAANPFPLWHYKEEDDGVLLLSLCKNNQLFEATGQVITLGVKNAAGNLIEHSTGITINGSSIDIVLNNIIFAVAGKLECELVLKDSNGKMSTANFYLVVGNKVLGSENVQSANVIGAIDACVQEYETWKDAVSAGKGAFINDNGQATTTVYSSTKTQAELDNINSSLETKVNINRTYNLANLHEFYVSDSREWGTKITEGLKKYRIATLNSTSYLLDTSVLYNSECDLRGSSWTNYGTKLRSSGDFPMLTYDNAITDRIRNNFTNILFDGVNLNNSYAVEINRMYMSTFEKCYFVNGASFNIEDSDSIKFIDCKFADSKKDVYFKIGKGSRSINFIGCNFENTQGNWCNVNILGDDSNSYTLSTNINFTNCQSERAIFTFDRVSNCIIDASKMHRTKIYLGKHTNNCRVINVADASSVIMDLGVNNIIEGCVGSNIAGFNVFKKNIMSDFIYNGNNNFGDFSKEYLFFTSVYPESIGEISNCNISYQFSNGNIIKNQSIDGYLGVDYSTQGTGIRQSFTDINLFKTSATENIKILATASGTIARKVVLKENKIKNGSFETTSNWNVTNCMLSLENNKLKVTVTNNGAWSISQQMTGLDANRNHMAISRTNKRIAIVIGNAHNGTIGARKCIGDIYTEKENEQYITQAFFTDCWNQNVSIGSLTGIAGDTFLIDWVAIVQLD